MKFEVYLEAVRNDILNELFNIKTININLQKIDDSDSFFVRTINTLVEENHIQAAKDILTIDLSKNKLLNYLSPEKQERFLDILSKIKSGDYYVAYGEEGRYLFKVANILYSLVFETYSNKTEIIFYEFKKLNDKSFTSNSLFKIKGAKDELFNKIRFIIQKEYASSLKTKVFVFNATTDDTEYSGSFSSSREGQLHMNNIDNVWAAYEVIIDEFKIYMNGGDVDLEEINYNLEEINKKGITFLKKYLTDKLLKAKVNQEDINTFLNSVLSSKEPPKKSKGFLNFKFTIGANDYDEMESMLTKNNMRERLYVEVIRSLVGDKVYINRNREDILFSLSPIKQGTPI
jgi:hypothetical protein